MCDYSAWESAVIKLKEGRHALKAYADFLKHRAALEEHYAKALLKLAKAANIDDVCADAPLANAWQTLRRQTENCAAAHSESARRVAEESTRVSKAAQSTANANCNNEDAVKHLQQRLKVDSRRFVDTKRAYETRCKEEIASNRNVYEERSRHGKDSREAERAEAKFTRQRDSLHTAEAAYKAAAAEAEKTRLRWEAETEKSLRLMQEAEERRAEMARESLWRLANVVSATCVAEDAAQEAVRRSVEDEDFVGDCVVGFIMAANGERRLRKRPKAIGYEAAATSSSVGLGPSTASLSRSSTSLQLNAPSKPPRLIHYASTASLTRKRANNIIDSVDNIEYFNLSSSSSLSLTESGGKSASASSSSYEYKPGNENWSTAVPNHHQYNERRIW